MYKEMVVHDAAGSGVETLQEYCRQMFLDASLRLLTKMDALIMGSNEA